MKSIHQTAAANVLVIPSIPFDLTNLTLDRAA